MNPNVVIIGSANVDFVMRLPRLPARGETVTDGEFRQVFGGKGANAAVAAGRAAADSTDVAFVARLGDDPFAPRMQIDFRDAGLDVGHVGVDPRVPSGTALVMFDASGDNYLSVAPGSNYTITPEHIDAAAGLFREGTVVLVQNEIPPAVTAHVIEVAHQSGGRVVLNYAPVRDRDLPIDGRLDGLIVNETEAAQLAGDGDAAKLADRLCGRGPAFVAITLGGEGVLLRDPAGTRTFPAFAVEPVDATAAGDTFCGALGVALAEGRSLDDAARFAQAAAALCVSGFGAQPSIPTRERISGFLTRNPLG